MRLIDVDKLLNDLLNSTPIELSKLYHRSRADKAL